MFWMKFVFWFSLSILLYCFIGYTILLWILVQAKKVFSKKKVSVDNNNAEPELTVIVAAYNEKDFIEIGRAHV